MAKLGQWVVDKRLPELAQSGALLDFQFFEAAYYRNYPEFVTVCEDLGLELGRPEWAQHKQDMAERTLLFDAVWAVQWENLLSDLADLPEREGEAPRVLQTVEKSHPQGWGGELNEVGQWRNTAGTYISGGQLAQIPEQSRELFGKVLFRMSTVSGGAEGPGWGGLKEGEQQVMASATLAGWLPGQNPEEVMRLEGFELAAPHRRFTLTLIEANELKTVEDVGQAWSLHNATPGTSIFISSQQHIISAESRGAWPMFVVDKEGGSLIAGEVTMGSRRPDFEGLLELCGTKSTDDQMAKKIAVARTLALTTGSAHFNETAEAKGKKYGKLGKIDHKVLGPFVNPSDGAEMSRAATIDSRLQAADGFKVPKSQLLGAEKSPCLTSH